MALSALVEGLFGALLQKILSDSAPERLWIALDTTVLWNRFCVIQVALVFRGRALPLARRVVEKSSASVRFSGSTLTFVAPKIEPPNPSSKSCRTIPMTPNRETSRELAYRAYTEIFLSQARFPTVDLVVEATGVNNRRLASEVIKHWRQDLAERFRQHQVEVPEPVRQLWQQALAEAHKTLAEEREKLE